VDSEERRDPAEPYRTTVRWGECDPFQIVFYPNYFAWFDEATWHHFARLGLPRGALEQRFGFAGFPLVRAGVEFHAPCRAGDQLEIRSDVVRWGRSSFDLRHRVMREGGRLLAAEGRETRVWTVSREGGIASDRIPDEIVSLAGGTRESERLPPG
jgi:4-hydroxybenzoyl-CoA thioesterase